MHKMRSHSTTVVNNMVIWMFSGCDNRDFWRDVLCLDIGTYAYFLPHSQTEQSWAFDRNDGVDAT